MKKRLIKIIPLLFSTLLSGCIMNNGIPTGGGNNDKPGTNETITAVTCNPGQLVFNKGDLSKEFIPTVTGEGEYNDELEITSNSLTTCTVDKSTCKSGEKITVTPVLPGSTEVWITSIVDSSKFYVLKVTVNDKEAIIPVESISISDKNLDMTIGDSKNLTATISPENATDKTFSWTSDNNEVAMIDGNGKVRALKAGTAHIKAVSNDGNKEDTCTVTVKKDQTITAGYYLVGSFAESNWQVVADYKMEVNPGNNGEMMISFLGHLNDELKVVYHDPNGGASGTTWFNADQNELGDKTYVEFVDGDCNVKLKANGNYTLYFQKDALGSGNYKYWFAYQG